MINETNSAMEKVDVESYIHFFCQNCVFKLKDVSPHKKILAMSLIESFLQVFCLRKSLNLTSFNLPNALMVDVQYMSRLQ